MDSKKITEPFIEASKSYSSALQGYGINSDGYIYYVVMERLVTKLNDIEQELKCAWRILDILNQECIKMWERLEKLEDFLYEQQNVVTQLVEFYASENNQRESKIADKTKTDENTVMGELDAIADSLGASLGVEETSVLREKLAHQKSGKLHELSKDIPESVPPIIEAERINSIFLKNFKGLDEEMPNPDEAFYRSLNNAYREDLISGDSSRPASQLDMIWEEVEDVEDTHNKIFIRNCIFEKFIAKDGNGHQLNDETSSSLKKEEIEQSVVNKTNESDEDKGEVFTAADYKTYRGDSPCISERDLAQLSRLSAIDKVSLEKLHKLNRLTSRFQEDSQTVLHSDSIESQNGLYSSNVEPRSADESGSIEERLKQIYTGTDVDNWTYSKSPGSTGRSVSRVSIDSGLATDGEFSTQLTSPKSILTSTNISDPTFSPNHSLKLSYAVTLLENSSKSIIKLPIDVGHFATGYAENKELTDLMVESYAPVTCRSVISYNTTNEKISSADVIVSPSIERSSPKASPGSYNSSHNVMNLKDDFMTDTSKPNIEFNKDRASESSPPTSPPPPAPSEGFSLESETAQKSNIDFFESPGLLKKNKRNLNEGQVSPRTPQSPKSLKISHKYTPQTSNCMMTAKSDSDLASTSGCTSIDKSHISPKKSIVNISVSCSSSHALSLKPGTPSLNSMSTEHLPRTTAAQEPLFDNLEGHDAIHNRICVVTSELFMGGSYTTPLLGYAKFPITRVDSHPVFESNCKISPSDGSKRINNYQMQISDQNVQPVIYSVAGSHRPKTIASVYTSGSNAYELETPTTKYHSGTGSAISTYENNQSQHTSSTNPNFSNHFEKSTKSISFEEATANRANCQTPICKSLFPIENITDALSYYPTSTNLPSIESDRMGLLSTAGKVGFLTFRSSRNKSSSSNENYLEACYTSELIENEDENDTETPSYHLASNFAYSNQDSVFTCSGPSRHNNDSSLRSINCDFSDTYSSNGKKENIHNIDQELVATCVDKEQAGEYYKNSSVIVSQSGYISIASDIKDCETDANKTMKKVRRGSSLKNAMNSMSSWLPDLHLTKRNRSQSLPGEIRREDSHKHLDSMRYEKSICGTILVPDYIKEQAPCKRKKYKLVSTVSGILQKAKRRTYQLQSFSDPEQYETEWNSGKRSVQGSLEDGDNIHIDTPQETKVISKIGNKTKMKQLHQLSVHQQKLSNCECSDISQQQMSEEQQEMQQENVFQDIYGKGMNKPVFKSDEPEIEKNVVVVDGEIWRQRSASTSEGSLIFPTVGDIKKSCYILEESLKDKTLKPQPGVLTVCASMEFAVSRALGKYRQRQSSTVFDDHMDDFDSDLKRDECVSQSFDSHIGYQENMSEKSDTSAKESKLSEVITNHSEEITLLNSSQLSSTKGHSQSHRFLPRLQPSLEIPWMGSRSGDGEEDNRSTHSFRSTSRVSSRRQSTEDSIDSEDEWYCYELRKLEELERQSKVVIETNESQMFTENFEESELYEPGDEIKEKMSCVLQELKMRTKPINTISEECIMRDLTARESLTIKIQNNQHQDERPVPKDKSAESLETVFARVTDYHTWAYEENIRCEKRPIIMEEDSSGDTSGPDSPTHSIEYEEDEFVKTCAEKCLRISSTSLQSEKFGQVPVTSLYRDNAKNRTNETSMHVPESSEFERVILMSEQNSLHSPQAHITSTLALPDDNRDTSDCASSDTVLKEDQVSPGSSASKWKLLKALKERKAEEKLKEVEEAAKESIGITQGPRTVSITI